MATAGEGQNWPFEDNHPEGVDSHDSPASTAVVLQALQATDKSGHDHARLLIGNRITGLNCGHYSEDSEHVSAPNTCIACDGNHEAVSELKEVRKELEKLQTEMHCEVGNLREEIAIKNNELDEKNKELSRKNKELEEAREEQERLKKKLEWKEEELQHEKNSKEWMQIDLNQKIARLEQEKNELCKTIADLKKQMEAMRQEMQVMNNQKASQQEFEQLQQKVESLSHQDRELLGIMYTKKKNVPQQKEYTEDLDMEFATNISLLMHSQLQGETNLDTKETKNGHNGHTSNEVLLSRNKQPRPENVDRIISDENNSNYHF